MRRLAVLFALLMLPAAIPPAGAADGVAFPDGEWEGTAIWTGSISKADVFASGSGTTTFTLGVADGEVEGGELTLLGKGQSQVPNATGKLTVLVELDLTGNAAVINGFGEISFGGSVKVEGFGTVPVAGSWPASGRFSPTFASCSKVTGDLATNTRQAQESYGFNTTVTANFVAVPTGGGAASEDIVAEYKSLVEDILEATTSGFTAEDLLALAFNIDALNAKILGLGACTGAPAGFEKGLSDTLLAALFQDALQAALDDAGQYGAQALLTLLGVGVRVGAVGLAVPGSAALQEVAESLHIQFEATLTQKLNEAVAAGDMPTIIDLLIGAQQFGMDGLADLAQGALAEASP